MRKSKLDYLESVPFSLIIVTELMVENQVSTKFVIVAFKVLPSR